MSQLEAYRQARHFDVQLKAAFVVDSTFMIYDPDDFVFRAEGVTGDDIYVPRPTAVNAVGNATNIAARLCSAAQPSQILVSSFERPGQGTEIMTPRSMIAQAAQVFRAEGSPAELAFGPDEPLHTIDKHGLKWHCWNLVGSIPNCTRGFPPTQRVGTPYDPTKSIDDVSFLSEPNDRPQ
jgi:hypothetical protein